MVDWYKDKQYVPKFTRKLSEAEATYSLREAWRIVYGKYPEDKSLALLWAQSALETGRWKIIRNNNFGNIKKRHPNPKYKIKDDGHDFTMFRCNEILWDNKLKKSVVKWFDPPHTQTHFRAYPSPVDGAEDYIRFLSQKKRYKKVWKQVILGDPVAYSHELKVAKYYTASEKKYTKGVVSLTNEFLRKKDKLLAWEPPEKPEPNPEPDPPEKPGEEGEIQDPFVIAFEDADVITPSPNFWDEDEIPTKPGVPHPSSYPPPSEKQVRKEGVGFLILAAIAGVLATILTQLEGCF